MLFSADSFSSQLNVVRAIAGGRGASAAASPSTPLESKIAASKPLETRFEPAIWLALSEAKDGFADHSRFTQRFGDILAIAAEHDADRAASDARALLGHINESNFTLAAGVASALSSPATRWRRRSAVRPRTERDIRNLASEGSLQDVLYEQALEAASPLLIGVGLTPDMVGLTVLMAFARAEAGRGSDAWRLLESAISAHFSGVRHGRGGLSVRTASNVGGASSAPAASGDEHERVLVVSFASRGVGIARHEFGATIRALATHGSLAHSVVDVLAFADTADGWYTQDGDARWRGATEVRRALISATRHADRVIFIGDSMGGAACLRFARFADLVVAFSPQVRLRGDPYVGRPELRRRWRSAAFEANLVTRALLSRFVCARGRRGGTEVQVHRGTGARDILNTRRLSSRVIDAVSWRAAAGTVRAGVTIIEHKGCRGHLLASKLAGSKELEPLLDLSIKRQLRHKN